MIERIWFCKIGGKIDGLPHVSDGADWPMRRAVQEAFKALTGRECEFTFSGWAGSLTEGERAVVENRPPNRRAPVADAVSVEECERAALLCLNPLADGDLDTLAQARRIARAVRALCLTRPAAASANGVALEDESALDALLSRVRVTGLRKEIGDDLVARARAELAALRRQAPAPDHTIHVAYDSGHGNKKPVTLYRCVACEQWYGSMDEAKLAHASPSPPAIDSAVVEELERLEKLATPGEWFGRGQYIIRIGDGPERCVANFPRGGGSLVGKPDVEQARRDREFVVALRNALPAILQALRRDRGARPAQNKETTHMTTCTKPAEFKILGRD